MAAGEVSGTLLAPDGWVQGQITWDAAGIITAVTGDPCAAPAPDESRLVAGFVDLHVHGGGGGDAMGGPDAVRQLARLHAQNGTAALAPTTMTAPQSVIATALDGVEAVRVAPPEEDCAQVLGVHLEGPFLNPKRAGAQIPENMLAYDRDLVTDWIGRSQIRIATVAPEIDGGLELVEQLAAADVHVQLGHTEADLTLAKQALATGATGFTHLYNAMPQLHHRFESVLNAALAYGQYAELICDLEHVSQSALLAAIRAIPHAYAITDATAAAGQADGNYQLAEQPVVKKGYACYTADGTLAGTALTMWDCRQNLLRIGLAEELAQAMVASRPAEYLGSSDLGKLAVGCVANIVCANLDKIDKVCLRGNWL